MSSGSELSLDFNPPHTHETVSGFLKEVSMTRDPLKRLFKVEELLKCLEEERKKIDAFKRELPFCMILINEAIEAVKEEEKQCRSLLAEKTRPVLEEFMPVKSKLDGDGGAERDRDKDSRDKMNWMSSAQLWSDNDAKNKPVGDLKATAEESERSAFEKPFVGCKSKNNRGAFMPVKGFSDFEVRKEEKEILTMPDLSLLSPSSKNPYSDSGIGCSKSNSGSRIAAFASSSAAAAPNIQSNSQQQLPRKARRCWSPELHRRFLRALDELGGSQVATPKQIRDVMKVEGLTNDEVKSHLQKYRLHTRRLPASAAATAANEQVVVMGGGMGGLWVPGDRIQASKQSTSQSSSPQGPLQLSRTLPGISNNGADSGEDEDGKSESYSWKSHRGSGEEET